MSDERLLQTMRETTSEMKSSMRLLMEKHGPDKIMFANSVVNCPKILKMLADSGTPISLLRLLEAQFKMMLACWGEARGYGDEINAIADGIREQEAIMEQDLMDAVKPAEGG